MSKEARVKRTVRERARSARARSKKVIQTVFPTTRYQKFLFWLFAAVWLWAAINPHYRADWLLENLLVIIVVPLIVLLSRYFRLSEVSYTLITIFTCLHLVGSHYTFSEVPFGYALQKWLGASRNMYDRLVHFSFGLLLFYPFREVMIRIAKTKGFWAYFIPLNLLLSLSAFFELIEWGVALIVSPDASNAYLGTQGDEWDAQKDMALAAMGALIALVVNMLIVAYYDKNFWKEFRSSFRLSPKDRPLGEVQFQAWQRSSPPSSTSSNTPEG